jgi:hypothetical protein
MKRLSFATNGHLLFILHSLVVFAQIVIKDQIDIAMQQWGVDDPVSGLRATLCNRI